VIAHFVLFSFPNPCAARLLEGVVMWNYLLLNSGNLVDEIVMSYFARSGFKFYQSGIRLRDHDQADA
jgi:hypothetical protein